MAQVNPIASSNLRGLEGTLVGLILMGMLFGCMPIPSDVEDGSVQSKSRNVWVNLTNFPNEQDIAILIPRDEDVRLRASEQNSLGERLLPEDWINQIGDAFLNTPVEDAFTEESFYEHWQAASIRLAPCSPLVTMPGLGKDLWCWPELRIVWQPTLYNIRVSWSSSLHPAYSDDRGIHALYDLLPIERQDSARAMLRAIRGGSYPDVKAFEQLRNRAITEMLNRLARLRGLGDATEGGLTYRTELMTEDGPANEFLARFLSTFDDILLSRNVHTVTAFSLPEGRQPAITNIWSFLAFEATDGQLQQKAIEIIDPNTGLVVGRLEQDETVAMASADHRLVEQIDEQGEDSPLKSLVLTDDQDRFEKGTDVNDPEKTLIPNTSCATCHSMNTLAFDFHNLSYFEQEEITIAPRVEADVRSELRWLKRWIEEP